MTGIPKPPEAENPGSFVTRPALMPSSWLEELVPYGIFTTDRELRIISWNSWLTNQSGRAALDMVGRNLTEIYPDLETRRLTERYARALEGEISVLSVALHKYLLPFPSTVPEHEFPHMLQSARIAPLPGGNGIAGTITIIEDVTQREFQAGTLSRQQELDRLLSSALAALLQANNPAAEMSGIFAAIRATLGLDVFTAFLLGPDGRKLRLHSATGISPKQRQEIDELEMSDGDLAALRHAPAPPVLNIAGHGEILDNFGISTRFSFPLAVGDRVLGLIAFGSYRRITPSPSDLGVLARIARYVGIAIDRARREQEVVTSSRAKDDFLAALSHELRTPLNPVLLMASDSAANPEFPEAAREAFRTIEKNAMLEARLIDDLLDLTRIAHGKLALEMRALAVHNVLRDALGTALADLRDRGLTVRMSLADVDVRAMGDAGRLQQVFWNVIKNAVKFSAAGGQIVIASTIGADGREISISITDSGIGMDEAELARVFVAFVQGSHAEQGRSHRFGGLGLGLAISRKLLELHSGRIEAHSPGKGKGSTFIITLPLLAQAPADKSGDPGAMFHSRIAPDSQAPFGAARKILLVEDHAQTCAVLTHMLTRRGFEVYPVASAEAACNAARERPFDMVLSDIGLPDCDGFILMRKLRDEFGLRGIALTGYGMEEDVARSTNAGFFAHLTKPINATLLDRTLEEAFKS